MISMRKRALSLLLVLTMLLGMAPVYAVDMGADTKGEILSFAKLEQTGYTASLGTVQEDIGLPEELTATVSEPVTTLTGTEDGQTITSVHTQQREAAIPVTWTCEDYRLADEGSYTFTAHAQGYTLADGVAWPTVTVTLEHRLARAAAAPLAEPGAEQVLYVSNKGMADGAGSRTDPMDLNTAVDQLNEGSGGTIYVMDDINDHTRESKITVSQDITLTTDPAAGGVATIWTKGNYVFAYMTDGATLTMGNLIVDGGDQGSHAVFILGATASSGYGHLVLGDGAVIRNCSTSFGAVWTNTDKRNSVTLKEGAVISGNTARSGDASLNAGYGGGVTLRGGTLTMEEGSKITGNTAVNGGGGVFVRTDATFNMEGGQIAGNEAPTAGGVYANGGTFKMGAAAQITGNRATGTAAQQGGGGVLAEGGQVTLRGQIRGNTATDGGGVYALGGSTTLDGATVIGNEAQDYGAGVFLDYRSGADMTLKGRVTILDNVSQHPSASPENNLLILAPTANTHYIKLDGLDTGSRIGVTMLKDENWNWQDKLFAGTGQFTRDEIEAPTPEVLKAQEEAEKIFASGCFTSDDPELWVVNGAVALISGGVYGLSLARDTSCYFVSSSGSDDNDGTRERPYKTLSKAITVVDSGEGKIYVMDDITETPTPGQQMKGSNLIITTDPKAAKTATVTMAGSGSFTQAGPNILTPGKTTLQNIIFDGTGRAANASGPFALMMGTLVLGDGVAIRNFTSSTPAVWSMDVFQATVELSGRVNVSGNTGGNLQVTDKNSVIVGEAGLAAGSQVGITDATAKVGKAFATGGAESAKYFTDDTGLFGVGSKDGQLIWIANDVAKIQETGKSYPTLQEAMDAVQNDQTIQILRDFTLDKGVTLTDKNVTLTSADGGSYTIRKGAGLTGTSMLTVKGIGALTIQNLVLDGGAAWTGEVNPLLGRGTVNSGLKSSSYVLYLNESGKATLGSGAVIQNNDRNGGPSVDLGGAVSIQGAEAGLTMEEGSAIRDCAINGGVGDGGAITVWKGSFTMTGGSITGCYGQRWGAVRLGGSDTNGGAVMEMSGGEITRNKGGQKAGGVMHLGYDKLTISGGAKIIGNHTSDGKAANVYQHRYQQGEPTDNGYITLRGNFTGSVGVTQEALSGKGGVKNANQPGAKFGVNTNGYTGAENFVNDVNSDLKGSSGGTDLLWAEQESLYVSSTGSDITGLGTPERPYKTLGKAIAAAASGGTIHIMDRVEVPTWNRVSAGKKLTITGTDQNGKRYPDAALVATGSLYTGGNLNTYGMFVFDADSELTIQYLTLDGSGVGQRMARVWSPGSALHLEAGTVVRGFVGDAVMTNFAVSLSGHVEITGNGGGIRLQDGTANALLTLSGQPKIYNNVNAAGQQANVTLHPGRGSDTHQLRVEGTLDRDAWVGVTDGAADEGVVFAVTDSEEAAQANLKKFTADNGQDISISAGKNLVWGSHVARVIHTGGTFDTYPTLQAAVDAAKPGETVELLRDTTENVTIKTTFAVLDWRGHTLTGATAVNTLLVNGGKVDVIRNTVDGVQNFAKGGVRGQFVIIGTVGEIAGGRYNATGAALASEAVAVGGEKTTRLGKISGGWFTGSNVAVTWYGDSKTGNGNYGKTVITGGVFDKGIVETLGAWYYSVTGENAVALKGGYFETQPQDDKYTRGSYTLAVTGTVKETTVSVNGVGGITSAVNRDFYYPVAQYVARTSNDGGKTWTQHETLQAAVDAVDTNSDTASYVELLQDVTLTQTVTTNKTFTLRSDSRQTGSFTLKRNIPNRGTETQDVQPFTGIMLQVNAGGAVTLTDIILDGDRAADPDGTYMMVEVTGTLTLGDGAILQNNYTRKDSNTAGAVYGQPGSTINIGDGVVLRWNEAQYGSAVTTRNGTINMTGGQIYGNYANRVDAGNGGAGAMSAWGGSAIINLSGGEISGNGAAQSAGGIVMDKAVVNISGTAVVKDNFLTNDKTPTLSGGRYTSGTQANLRFSPTSALAANNLNLAGDFTGWVGVTQNDAGTGKVDKANQAGTQFGQLAEGVAAATGAGNFFNDVDSTLRGTLEDGVLKWGAAVARTSNDGGKTWTEHTTLQAAVDAVDTNSDTASYVELLTDVTVSANITTDKTFTLRSDSDGDETRTLTRDPNFTGIFFILNAGADVTIEDLVLDGNKENMTATKDVNYLISVQKDAQLTLEDGAALQHNASTKTANMAGAVWLLGTMTMKDGSTIRWNEAQYAAAIAVYAGTLNMEGGTIIGNYATRTEGLTGSGAIHIWASGTMDLTGGSITGNAAAVREDDQDAGGVILETGALNISGDAEITGNYLAENQKLVSGSYTDGTLANLTLFPNTLVTLNGPFTGSVGVTQLDEGGNQAGSVFGTAGENASGAGNFFNDVNGELMGTIKDGALMWTDDSAVARTSNNGGRTWTEYTTLQEAVDAVDTNGDTDSYVELLRSLELDTGITVDGGRDFVLRSGTRDGDSTYTVKRAAGALNGGDLFHLSGGANITVADLVIDGNKDADTEKANSHLFYVTGGADLTLNAGAVLQNNRWGSTHFSGTILVSDSAQTPTTVTMNEGAVIRNNESTYGAAITLYDGNETFIMNGGEITGNHSRGRNDVGAAVYVQAGSTFQMKGGKISGNTNGEPASGLGAGVQIADSSSSIQLSGDAQITDNTIQGTGTASNLSVRGADRLSLAGDFTGRVDLFSTEEGQNAEGAQFGVNTSGYSGAEHFFNDKTPSLAGSTQEGTLVWKIGGVARTSNDGGTTWDYYPILKAAVQAVKPGNPVGQSIVELLQDTTEKEILLSGNYVFTLRSSTREEEKDQRFTVTLDKEYDDKYSPDLFELSGCTVTMHDINLGGDGEARKENGKKPSKLLSVKSGTNLTLKDVTISGNYGDDITQAAVVVTSNSKLTLSGSVFITGSYEGDDLYLTNDSRLTLADNFTGAVNVTESWRDGAEAADQQFGLADGDYTGAEHFVNAKDPSLVGAIKDGTTLVWQKAQGEAVARVDNGTDNAWVGYPSLAAAIASLKADGHIVELLQDVTENGTITSDKNFTLQSGTRPEDNGNTYTAKRGAAVTLLNLTGDVTLKNIALDGGAVYDEEKLDTNTWWAGMTGVSGGGNSSMLVRVTGGSLTMEEGAKLQNTARPGGTTYGAALLLSDAELTMKEGSSIERNLVATTAPAVRAMGASQVNINGGVVQNNACTASQGIVVLEGTSGLTMTDGGIQDNFGSWYGGALLTNGANTVDLSGGKITGNRSGTNRAPAGVNINANSKLTLSGSITIYDNTTSTGAQANLSLWGPDVLTIRGELTGKVGITDRWTGAQNVAGEVFGTSIGASGLEQLKNDADEALYAVLDGIGVKWAPAVAKIVGGANDGKTYGTLAAAIADYGSGASHIQMIDNSKEADIEVDRKVYVDLAGFTVTADVKVDENCDFYGFDTRTNGYDAASDTDFGHILGTVSGHMAATTSTSGGQTGEDMRYVTITQGEDTSFHRFDLKLGNVVFRPSVAGIYFKSAFYGDQWVKDEIRRDPELTYGLFLGLAEDIAPNSDNAARHEPSDFQTGESGDQHQGSMIQNIVVEGNADNKDRTNTPIWVNTYFNFADADIVTGDVKHVTLTNVVEGTASMYQQGTLSPQQMSAFEGFWDKYSDLYPEIKFDPKGTKQDEE